MTISFDPLKNYLPFLCLFLFFLFLFLLLFPFSYSVSFSSSFFSSTSLSLSFFASTFSFCLHQSCDSPVFQTRFFIFFLYLGPHLKCSLFPSLPSLSILHPVFQVCMSCLSPMWFTVECRWYPRAHMTNSYQNGHMCW